MSFDDRPFSVDFTESYVQTHYVLWCTIRMHYNLPSPGLGLLRVAIVGNIPALGMWDVKQAIIARDDGNGMKSVTLNIEQGTTLLFKWIITDNDGNVCRWEEGEDKVLHIPRIMAGTCDILAPWDCDANILSVHDRYGTKCCLEEVIRFANMDLDTFMNRKTTWREIVDKSITSNDADIAMNKFLHKKQVLYETAYTKNSSSDARKGLEKEMNGKQEESRTMEREISSKDNIAEHRLPTRTWQHKIAAGIGIMSGIVIGGSVIYLTSLQASEPEPEPEADFMQTNYEFDMTNKAYDMINGLYVYPPAVHEPSTREQLTVAVESTYKTVVQGISSLIRSFF